MKSFVKNTFIKLAMVIAALVCVALISNYDVAEVYAKDADGDYVVVIDPGHGGNDPGAVSATTGDTENKVNWNIAVALKAELETYSGVKVYLTRGSAEYQSNVGRASTARELGADLTVSLHNNSSEATSANGVICYGTVDARFKEQVKTLCNSIANKINALGIEKYRGGYEAKQSSYSATSDFYTLIGESVRSGIPALLVEHCYLSNDSDAAFINKLENQYKLGVADATAIAQHFGLKKRGVNAGASISLTRTYSAYMLTAKTGTYSVSDSSVVSVRDDGLITALKPGTSTVTCTASDGSKETVKVTVPEVKAVKLVAGSIQNSFLSKDEAYAYDKERLMVKVIYSDGSVAQLDDGYTLGEPVEGEATDEGNGHVMTEVNVPVTYGDLSCTLRLYHYTKLGLSTGSSAENYKVVGTNSDVCLVPDAYEGLSDGVAIEVDSSIVIQEAADEQPSADEQDNDDKAQDEQSKGGEDSDMFWVLVACVILLIVILIAIVILLMMYKKRKNSRW